MLDFKSLSNITIFNKSTCPLIPIHILIVLPPTHLVFCLGKNIRVRLKLLLLALLLALAGQQGILQGIALLGHLVHQFMQRRVGRPRGLLRGKQKKVPHQKKAKSS